MILVLSKKCLPPLSTLCVYNYQPSRTHRTLCNVYSKVCTIQTYINLYTVQYKEQYIVTCIVQHSQV